MSLTGILRLPKVMERIKWKYAHLSNDVAFGRDITACNKIDLQIKEHYIMTLIVTLRKTRKKSYVLRQKYYFRGILMSYDTFVLLYY